VDPQAPPRDPRPLPGEPLALDLLNTVRRDAGGVHDLLDEPDGLRRWLAVHDLPAEPSEGTRAALRAAREAIRAHVAAPDGPGTRDGVNAVLARGVLRRVLTATGPEDHLVVDRPEDLPAWRAADDYVRLRAAGPDRIRRCDHPECVLHFYDTSARNTRRWCSMAGCGNRSKAARHYRRSRGGGG
jgi:predicted RNA-binding Zn ribbon-like protein